MPIFTVNLNGEEILLPEAETRDEALIKAGLTPEHWKEKKGENMDEVLPTEGNTLASEVKTRKPRSDKGQSRTVSEPPKLSPGQRKGFRKPNITTEDLARHQLYIDSTEIIYRLSKFVPEPQIEMTSNDGGRKEGTLSDFANFRRLIPEPEPRKRIKKQE